MNKIHIHIISGIALALLLSACGSSRIIYDKAYKETVRSLESESAFKNHFTGFALYDPTSDDWLVQHNSEKFFTPASNIKTWTAFAAEQALPDLLPSIVYTQIEEGILIKGCYDPSFLHPEFEAYQAAYDFLSAQKGPIYFLDQDCARYGEGWMWDDYPYAFQAERNSFPIYGNVFHIERAKANAPLQVQPSYFEDDLSLNPGSTFTIKRKEGENSFSGTDDGGIIASRSLAFRTSPELVADLLQDSLDKAVLLYEGATSRGPIWDTIYACPRDSLIRKMMYDSDNHMAEHLILMAAGGATYVEAFIKKNKQAWGIQDSRWVDGSGLSRYNLISPQEMIQVLGKIYQDWGPDKIKKIFPRGKRDGTISDLYGPYVYAKTGTMSNKHCLSGFIHCRSGKMLAFSFMHNHYLNGSSQIKMAMSKILEEIHQNN